MCAVNLECTKNQEKQTRNGRGRKECLQEERFSASNLFLLAQTVSYNYLLIFCVICLIFRAFKSDYTHEDSVHFKHEIWPLIHFYRKVGQFFLLVEWIHGEIHMDRVCRASIMGLPGVVGVLYVTYLTFTRTNVLTCISMSIYPDMQSESEHSMIYCI